MVGTGVMDIPTKGTNEKHRFGRDIADSHEPADQVVVSQGQAVQSSEEKRYEEGIGRLAKIPIEELVYHANIQRVSYGMHTG